MLTKKMQAMKIAIDDIISSFPSFFLDEVFSEDISKDDILIQIMVELCKYAYDYTSGKHPIDYYIKLNLDSSDIGSPSFYDYETEHERMRMEKSRIIKMVNEYRRIWYGFDSLTTKTELDEYLIQEIKDNQSKFKGHSYSEFQYWEICNIHDMKWVKDFVDKHISAKNYTQDKFIEMANQYDSQIEEYRKLISSDDIDKALFGFLAIFTLEWKYSFNYFYKVVTEIEKRKAKNTDEIINRTGTFTSYLTMYPSLCFVYPQTFGNSVSGENRLLTFREHYIHDLVTKSEKSFSSIRNHHMNINALIILISSRKDIRDYFVRKTTKDDWISVFREYRIDDILVDNKIWSPKRIRYMKQVNRLRAFDYKNPENRS